MGIAASVLVLAAAAPVARGVEDALPSQTSAQELLDRAFRNLYADDFVQVVRLVTKSRTGRSMSRRLQIVRKQSVQPGKALVRFLDPFELRGTSMLVIEHSDRHDEVFLYLPAFEKVRRVSSAQRFDAFFGTDFSYEDLEPKTAADYEGRIVGRDRLDEVPCTLVECRARRGFESQYERTVACIDPERAVILWIDFYLKGKVSKRLASDPRRIEQVGDRWVPFEARITSHARGSETLLVTESYELRGSIPDSLFTAANMELGDSERDRERSQDEP
jgi:hypothetical protein